MGYYLIDLGPSCGEDQAFGHCPADIVLGLYLFDIPLVEIEGVGIFEEYSQLAGRLEPAHRELALFHGCHGRVGIYLQLTLVDIEQDKIIEGLDDLVIKADIPHGVDAVILDLDADLQLILREQTFFVCGLEFIELIIFSVQIIIIDHRAVYLDYIGRIFHFQGAEDLAEAVFDRSVAPELAEEAEFYRVDLDNGAVILAVILDKAVAYAGKGDDLIDIVVGLEDRVLFLLLLFRGRVFSFLPFLPDSIFLLVSDIVAGKALVLFPADLFLVDDPLDAVAQSIILLRLELFREEVLPVVALVFFGGAGDQVLIGKGPPKASGEGEIFQEIDDQSVIGDRVDPEYQQDTHGENADGDIHPGGDS